MQALNQLVTSLGAPVLLRQIKLRGACRVTIARWRFGGGRVDVDATDAVRAVMCLSGADEVSWQVNGETERRPLDVCSVSVVSPSEPPHISVHGSVSAFLMLIEPALIEEVANQSQVHIFSSFDSHRDQLRRPMLQALVAAQREDPDDALLLSSAVYDLAEQLSLAGGKPVRQRKGGLARAARRRVEELIRDRLDRTPGAPPTLGDMATAAGLSVHHFIKAFRQTMGITPYAYSLGCRLQRSMRLLSETATSIAEAADRTGFNSPAHFVSSFRRHNGLTPGAFREAIGA